VWPHHPARGETRDFGEILDWVARQPWSDGQVAGWGTSYSANTADRMAERDRPALRAVIARFPDDDPAGIRRGARARAAAARSAAGLR
jgi:predicted acyl esterase